MNVKSKREKQIAKFNNFEIKVVFIRSLFYEEEEEIYFNFNTMQLYFAHVSLFYSPPHCFAVSKRKFLKSNYFTFLTEFPLQPTDLFWKVTYFYYIFTFSLLFTM